MHQYVRKIIAWPSIMVSFLRQQELLYHNWWRSCQWMIMHQIFKLWTWGILRLQASQTKKLRAGRSLLQLWNPSTHTLFWLGCLHQWQQQIWSSFQIFIAIIHSILHSASEIMLWGSLINCSGEAAETAHKINVKGPGSNVNQRDSALGTLMTHARRKETARLMGSAIQGKNMS